MKKNANLLRFFFAYYRMKYIFALRKKESTMMTKYIGFNPH